ncbi:hypothetical protein E2C01_044707 [Portunus trituberculatus]|uniref:Uncharacterized protein n=1 Tax=Portunus trituberculatus TaxID=210409 RepID=A0A5B7G0Q6_PORTR|nr:hypothetical protein [Portunus trituberculatus]
MTGGDPLITPRAHGPPRLPSPRPSSALSSGLLRRPHVFSAKTLSLQSLSIASSSRLLPLIVRRRTLSRRRRCCNCQEAGVTYEQSTQATISPSIQRTSSRRPAPRL